MLVVFGILLIFGLVVCYKWKNGAAKKEEILRLVAVASEEEEKIARIHAFEEYNAPLHPQPQLEKQYYCAVCHSPTSTRCSQCKAVRYCSGKCQIIHWRQGHKDECRTATSPSAGHESGYDVETASENQSQIYLQNKMKIHSDAGQEFNDFRSSSSSTSRLYSSTDFSESSFDASTSEAVKFGIPIQLDKAASAGIHSRLSKTISRSGDADVPSPSPPACSVNYSLGGTKIEKTRDDENLRSAIIRDKRKGDVSMLEVLGNGGNELRTSRSSSAARTSSAEESKKLTQMSADKVVRSVRSPGYRGMPNVESNSECSKSLKISLSDENWRNESQACYRNETKSTPTYMSSANYRKMAMKTDNPYVISSETEGFRNMPHDTSKSLKTSVWKFVQHFKASKQLNMVKDLGGTFNHKIIFPVDLFMRLYSCGDVELHPYGLVNCGNSCYANAVLQCLTFTRPIASYLLHGLHSKTCQKMDWCFICKFEHLIRKGQTMNSPLSPVGLLTQIQRIGREEDAHEFLRNVVDKMQSTCLEEAGASCSLSEDSTLMGLTFGGYLRSKIKCMNCSGRSERFDRMMDLTVEIEGNIWTLEDALTQFTISETLSGDDKYKCSRCKSYEKAKKKLTVLEAPNILTIVLKRFRSGNIEKLNKLVKFPEVLDLSPYMSGMKDKYPTYQLYAVVVHLGMNTSYSGHYVSYIRDFVGQWFKIDDSLVSHVDLETVLSLEAYMLFYERHSPRGVSVVRTAGSHSKKKNSKPRPNSSGLHAGPTWMSPNDFSGYHKNNHSFIDSSFSDSSSIFSTSDASSYSTDSTKDSSADDISGYLFGSTWYNP